MAGQLQCSLDSLITTYEDNAKAGALGAMAITELCNALVDTQVLEALDALQKHEDPGIANQSTKLFQHVIPRIWSL